jgi:ankyrin repeat protein
MGIKEFFQTIQWGATLQVAAIRIVIASVIWPLLFVILGNTKAAEFFPLVFGFILVLGAFIAIAIPAIGLVQANVPYIGLAALPAWMVVVADPLVKLLHSKRPDMVPVDEFKWINPPVLAVFQTTEPGEQEVPASSHIDEQTSLSEMHGGRVQHDQETLSLIAGKLSASPNLARQLASCVEYTQYRDPKVAVAGINDFMSLVPEADSLQLAQNGITIGALVAPIIEKASSVGGEKYDELVKLTGKINIMLGENAVKRISGITVSYPESSKQDESNNNLGTSTSPNSHCQDLISSIENGQSETVQSLLDYEDVWNMENYRDAELDNPLTLAIKESGSDGITDVLKILAEKKFLINEISEYNHRPILSAIRLGNVAALNLLINNGAELNWSKIDYSWPPALASVAIYTGEVPKDRLVSIIELLSQRGAEVNSSEGPALHYAMCANDRNGMRLAVLKKLIEIGADVNQVAVVPSLIHPAGSHIGTPIFAYYASGIDAVRILLDNGADLDAKNNHGENSIEFFEGYKKRAPSETETVDEIISLLRAHTR